MLQLLNENENEILGSTDVGSSWHNIMIIWLVAGREAGVSPLVTGLHGLERIEDRG